MIRCGNGLSLTWRTSGAQSVDYFQIRTHQPYQTVLSERRMPGENWFTGSKLNYAEHALRRRDEHVAGDWIKMTPRGSCVIYGRSDSTLNRGGVRMGTSEFYRVVEELPEVLDSLVVDVGHLGENERLLLFVVLPDRIELDPKLLARVNEAISQELSPRHIPDEIYQVAEVPRTLSGKKLEVPVKRILSGIPVEEAVSKGVLANPEAIRFFMDLASQLRNPPG